MRRMAPVTVGNQQEAAATRYFAGHIFCISRQIRSRLALIFMELRIKRKSTARRRTQRDNTGGPFVDKLFKRVEWPFVPPAH